MKRRTMGIVALAMALCAGLVPLARGPAAQVTVQGTGQPPYEAELLRLAEILGAIHFIDTACETADAQVWRDRMIALVEAEAPSPERRAKLVDRFNRGYRGFAEVHRGCTDSARLLRENYLREGAEITDELQSRFGVSVPASEPATPTGEKAASTDEKAAEKTD